MYNYKGSQLPGNSGNYGIIMGFYKWTYFGMESWKYHENAPQCHGNQGISWKLYGDGRIRNIKKVNITNILTQ